MVGSAPLLLAVGLTVLFAFINGFHDGCNVVATAVASRSLSPRAALFQAALAELVGPLILGTAVAATIANRVLLPEFLLNLLVAEVAVLVCAALLGAIVWNLVTWWLGLPSSSSHALIGGLVGAGVMQLGPTAVAWESTVTGVVLPLLVAPVLGGLGGLLLAAVVRGLFARTHPSVKMFFAAAQGPGMWFLAASHGSNDAQKSIGMMALALAASQAIPVAAFEIPWWTVVLCAAALAAGLAVGGWRIIRTVGFGIVRLKPVDSFAAQYAAGGIVLAASLLGGPVSTSQIVASSVVGVGTARRLSAVRWGVVGGILMAWIITIPAAGLVAAVFTSLLWYAFGLW